MKKPTILKIAIFFLFFLSNVASSQNLQPFARKFNGKLRGDILTIGNNILNRDDGTGKRPNDPYNGVELNSTFTMKYINIDPTTSNGITNFSSSSATLTIPNSKPSEAPCYKIAYAALYWSGILQTTTTASRANINKVRLKVPGATAYNEITGTIVKDAYTTPIAPDASKAYVCMAEITNLLNATSPNGVYTVANVLSSEGTNGATGLSAGWSLFIVYEDANLPTRAISSFDGLSAMATGAADLNTTISGFTTIPTGGVKARFAFAALEGDRSYNGDYLKINDITITPTLRPRTTQGRTTDENFFNSTINNLNVSFTDRVPNSTNTLGYDAGVIDIDPSLNIIKNNQTSAKITLGTNQEVYFYYFMAFSVEIIAPNIKLTKSVEDAADNDASNKNVTLGEELRYTLKFQNVGNDHATSFKIVDKLPVNTTFLFPSDTILLPKPIYKVVNGTKVKYKVTMTYDSTNRIITFDVPNVFVEINDPLEKIRFKVHVVDDCSKLTDACSNLIKNSAFTSYKGYPANLGGGGDDVEFGDQSYAIATGCNVLPQSTNFLVGIDACKSRSAEICLSEMEISASGGYGSYRWSSSPTYSPVLGTEQKLKITGPGKYYVYNTAKPDSDCKDFEEVITVTDGGGVKTNPIIAYADNKQSDGTIKGCDIDGKPLPKIFLCGTNDSRLFNLNLPQATIVWEYRTCNNPTDAAELCADESESASCPWLSAGANGSIFTAKDAGNYRVTITSGGCVNRYYFKVYKSDVTINETHKNILCNNPGSITVDKLTGYEFSLTHVLIPASSSTTTAYTDNNVFSITTAGNYIVNYRLKNVNPTCVYKTNQIIIAKDDFTATVDNPNENPNCYGEKGRLQVSATSGFTGYYYTLYQDGVKVQELGPLPDRTHAFELLDPGKAYLVEVFTKNADQSIQCIASAGRTIPNAAAELKVTSSLLLPLTACEDGQYLITASGGSGGYSFFVDGSTTAQPTGLNGNTDPNSIILLTPTAKEYTILVRDSKLCTTTYKFTVPAITKPAYTIEATNAVCYSGRGKIEVKLTNGTNGYVIGYSIDNGANFQADPVFLDVAPGAYNVVVKYGLTYTIPNQPLATRYCTDPAQLITIAPQLNALTASGGVGELAGCTLSGLGGKLRITNVQVEKHHINIVLTEVLHGRLYHGKTFCTELIFWLLKMIWDVLIRFLMMLS